MANRETGETGNNKDRTTSSPEGAFSGKTFIRCPVQIISSDVQEPQELQVGDVGEMRRGLDSSDAAGEGEIPIGVEAFRGLRLVAVRAPVVW